MYARPVAPKEPSTTIRIRVKTLQRLRCILAEESEVRGKHYSLIEFLDDVVGQADEKLAVTREAKRLLEAGYPREHLPSR